MDSNEKLYHAFVFHLNNFDRASAVGLVLDVLEKSQIDLVTLYEDILAPSLNTIASNEVEQNLSIWQEHVTSGIVRTVLEACYPFVIKERRLKYQNDAPPLSS